MHRGIFSIKDLFQEVERALYQNLAVLETSYDSFFIVSQLNYMLTERKELQMKKWDIQYLILNHYNNYLRKLFSDVYSKHSRSNVGIAAKR